MIGSLNFDFAGRKETFFPWLLFQPVGWLVTLAAIVARLRHDVIPRTLNLRISQTNEMVVPRAYKQRDDGRWIVDVQSKITMQLVRFVAWLNWIAAMLGPIVWGLFKGKGYGWMDFPPPNEKYAINSLDCGGNVVEVLDIFGVHALVATQDITEPPNLELSYKTHPHLFIKQTIVGNNAAKEMYIIADQNRGDLVIPFMTDEQAAFPLSALEFLRQEFPFEAVLWGRLPVVIDKVVFQGSDAWAHIGNSRWVCIDWMEVTGLGSWRDRRLSISPEHWFGTSPPPVKGWIGTKDTPWP